MAVKRPVSRFTLNCETLAVWKLTTYAKRPVGSNWTSKGSVSTGKDAKGAPIRPAPFSGNGRMVVPGPSTT